MNECDLLIVNHNTKSKLARLLTTLNDELVDSGINIYVQDNGSTDGSVEMLQNEAIQELYTDAWSMPNVGYSRAINRMASMTNSEYLAALNGDVWLTAGQAKEIVRNMSMNEDIAVSSPKQRNEKGEIVHAGIIGTNVKPRHRGWKQSDKQDSLYRDTIECVTVSGSAYFMRRSVWDEVVANEKYQRFNMQEFGHYVDGGFLQTPHYYEETFYSYFVRHLGYKVIYDGTVSIGHTWHASSEIGQGHDNHVGIARGIFRRACDHLGIARD